MRDWIIQRYRAYGQRLLLAGIFLVPLLFHRGSADVFNLVKLSLLWVLGLVALWCWLSWSLERGIWLPRFYLGYATGAFLAVYGLATVFSQYKILSLVGVYHRYGGFIPFALYALLMLVFVGFFWEQPDRLKTVAKSVTFASLVLVLYALIQAAGQDWIPWRAPGGALPEFPLSTMGNSNFAGGYIGIAIPFAVYLILATEPPRRYFYWVILVLDFLALWATSSRGGMIGAAAGLATSGFLYRDRLNLWVRRSIAVALIAGTTIAVLVVWHPGLQEPPAGLAQFTVLRTETLRIRQYYWSAALRIFADHPIIGTGPDTFYANYGAYRLPSDGEELGLSITDKPHNIFLEYASNSGILGLGGYLAVVGMALWYVFRQSNRKDDPNRTLLVCFGSAFAAYLSQGFFSIDVPPLAVMGWLLIGGIAVLADPGVLKARQAREVLLAGKQGGGGKKSKQPADESGSEVIASSPTLSRKSRRIVQALGAIVVVLLAAVGLRPLLADMKARKAELISKSGASPQTRSENAQRASPKNAQRALDEVKDAIGLYPVVTQYHIAASQYAVERAAPDESSSQLFRRMHEAEGFLLQAQRLEPTNVFIAMHLARLYIQWGRTGDLKRFEQSDSSWRKAIKLDPTNWQVRFNYAAFLNVWGIETKNPEIVRRSIDLAEEIARDHPRELLVWKAIGQSYLAIGENEKSRRAFSRALEISPGNPVLLELLELAEGRKEAPSILGPVPVVQP